MRKLLLLGLLLAAVFAGLSGCTMTSRPLEGTWTVDSIEDSDGNRDLGDGTITLSFDGEFFGIESYSGTAVFDGDGTESWSYTAEVDYWPDSGFGITIELSEPGDESGETIDLYDSTYSGGSTISGVYYGWVDYSFGEVKDIGEGTFTAIK
jgi:hypothetical protein